MQAPTPSDAQSRATSVGTDNAGTGTGQAANGGRREAVVIVNTKSRRGQEWFGQVKESLARPKSGINVRQAWAIPDPKLIAEKTREAIAARTPLVIIGGGDGTFSLVARHFVGSDSVLGVLPLGTGNQFARDLGIEADVDAACRALTHGKVAHVDLGIAGDDYFLNVATIGLTTLVARELTNEAKRRWGRLVYAVAVTRALRKVRPFRVTLTTDAGTTMFETLQVVIGNGRFHAGPFPLAPNATINDGQLVVYALAGANRWQLLRYALNLPGGHHVELPDVPATWTRQGKIETTPPQSVTVDGEIVFRTPLAFGIAPGALRVMVPQEFEGA